MLRELLIGGLGTAPKPLPPQLLPGELLIFPETVSKIDTVVTTLLVFAKIK